MEEIIPIDKNAIADLARLTNEINDRVESIILMGNKEFINSLRKSDEQIQKRDFADWDAL